MKKLFNLRFSINSVNVNKSFSYLFLVIFILLISSCSKPQTAIPVSRIDHSFKDGSKWIDFHNKFNLQAKNYTNTLDILWLGDSITEFWQREEGRKVYSQYFGKFKALNFALRGDRIEHLLWRIQNGNLDNINPKIISINIGANNWMHTTDEIIYGVRQILKELRKQKPDAQIILHGIFPQGKMPSEPVREKLKQINEDLSQIKFNSILFVDLSSEFLNEDETISGAVMPDYLHLSEIGYSIWAKELILILNKYLI